jgi:hypothetical protein
VETRFGDFALIICPAEALTRGDTIVPAVEHDQQED